jgi:hypothetical protein
VPNNAIATARTAAQQWARHSWGGRKFLHGHAAIVSSAATNDNSFSRAIAVREIARRTPLDRLVAMTDQIVFDRNRYIDRLTRAGISDDDATAFAEALETSLRVRPSPAQPAATQPQPIPAPKSLWASSLPFAGGIVVGLVLIGIWMAFEHWR